MALLHSDMVKSLADARKVCDVGDENRVRSFHTSIICVSI